MNIVQQGKYTLREVRQNPGKTNRGQSVTKNRIWSCLRPNAQTGHLRTITYFSLLIGRASVPHSVWRSDLFAGS